MGPLERNLAAHRERLWPGDDRLYGHPFAGFVAPLFFYLVGIESQIRGVVAEEAAGVYVPGQVGELAGLQGR